jgi:hypothetical protein
VSTDIATLGLAVDSSQITGATDALDAFQRAAGNAANASDQLNAAAAKNASAYKALETALERAVADINVEVVAVRNGTSPLNDHAKAHGNLSVQAMAAQHSIRSMVESIAYGMSPTQALTGQINHLSFAASGPQGLSGAFKEATSALTAFVSPTGLIVGGLVAIAAGGVIALNSIAKVEKQFDDTASAASVTIGALHDLASAASFKGIDSTDFLKGINQFSAQVYQAQHNAGSLNEVMIANGQSAKTFSDYFDKAADIIKNATSDQQRLQLLQAMGLPATMDWVRYLSQGSDGIKQAAAEATKFGDTADAALVAKAREFDEAWQKSITNFSNGFKSGLVDVIGYFDKMNSAVNSLLSKAGINVGKNLLTDAMRGGPTASTTLTQSAADELYKAAGTTAPFNAATGAGTSKLPSDAQNAIAKLQPPLGLYGQTPTAKQAAKPKPEDKDNDRDHLRLLAAA